MDIIPKGGIESPAPKEDGFSHYMYIIQKNVKILSFQ